MPETQPPSGLSDKEKIEVLMNKYSFLRQEIVAHLNNYKAHVKYFQVLIGTIIAIAGIMKEQNLLPFLNSRLYWLTASVFITTVVSYVALDIVQSLYSISVLAARLSSIEDRVNTLANERLLAWETALAPLFHRKRFPADDWSISPGYALVVYEFILIALGVFSIPTMLFVKFWNGPTEHLSSFRILLIISILYSVGSMLLVVSSLNMSTNTIRLRALKIIHERLAWARVHYK
jgi:hypothetical protein